MMKKKCFKIIFDYLICIRLIFNYFEINFIQLNIKKIRSNYTYIPSTPERVIIPITFLVRNNTRVNFWKDRITLNSKMRIFKLRSTKRKKVRTYFGIDSQLTLVLIN